MNKLGVPIWINWEELKRFLGWEGSIDDLKKVRLDTPLQSDYKFPRKGTTMAKRPKQRVYLTDDMKHKVAREYKRAPRAEKKSVASKYNVTASSINSWIKSGFGADAPESRPKPARPLNEILASMLLASLEAKAISEEEALVVMRHLTDNKISNAA